MIPCIIIGAGGHSKVLIDALEQQEIYQLQGLIAKEKGKFLNYPIMGDDSLLPWLLKEKKIQHCFIGIGGITHLNPRIILFNMITDIGFISPSLIHPFTNISKHTSLGKGVQIFAGSTIAPGVSIGNNCIINHHVSIDHDCQISDHCHLAPGTILSGAVKVGKKTYIGSGSIIKEGIKIGKDCVIGAGSVVIRDVPAGKTIFGNPAHHC